MSGIKRRVLSVIMDGVGVSSSTFGNAVGNALTPNMKWLKKYGAYRTLLAHGTAVGLPSDADIGNSEVGHNALGAGRIFDQGAKLVDQAFANGSIFSGSTWKSITAACSQNTESTLHLIGLLSDGNVHSHESHVHQLIIAAKKHGIKQVRIHVLFDGRDVSEKSAEIYIDRLEKVMHDTRSNDFDIEVASGGGRMHITMDRYEADWSMVERGWKTHVCGEAEHYFDSLSSAIKSFRKDDKMTDQYIPSFVIMKNGEPTGQIKDGDCVVFFNFRGDRAIEISRAFTEEAFKPFDRKIFPKVYYAGMMQYDGDLHIPNNYLVTPPLINDTFGEHLARNGLRQFACSETQKYGHVTYFWNGNRSGCFDPKLEEYLQIPSDNITFERKPWMKAHEITEATVDRMRRESFDFGRINFANGDMVGHTGDYEATIIAVETVDLMLGRLISAAKFTNTILVVTADHGNADEMFDAKEKDYLDWQNLDLDKRPRPKTAHTLNPVPFYIYDPTSTKPLPLASVDKASLGNLANTALKLMGLPNKENYLPSLIQNI
jgi:2,3-bisphosphoglycerate-independent phosphoglycerate mutase